MPDISKLLTDGMGLRQKNMDWALFQVFVFLYGIFMVLVLYDIYCFYGVHLLKRFEKSPCLSMPPSLQIIGGIDQFHVHGHQKQCYARYSPHFIPGAGIQLMDVIETLWININQVSDSTRGMTSAHRQEVIDDIMNDSNWNKLIRHSMSPRPNSVDGTNSHRAAAFLVRKWVTACEECPAAQKALEDLTPKKHPGRVRAWRKMAEDAARDRRNRIEVMDVYEVEASKSEYPPALIDAERNVDACVSAHSGRDSAGTH